MSNRSGIIFIATPILIVMVVGGMSNLFVASGLAPPGANAFTLTCDAPGSNPSPICTNPNSMGCNVIPLSCTLQNNFAIKNLLNPNSPFTTLLSGNVLGFLAGISASTTIVQNVYSATGLGPGGLIPGVCTTTYIGNSSSQATWLTTSCSAADQHNNALPPTVAPFLAPAPGSANSSSIPFSGLTVTNKSATVTLPSGQKTTLQYKGGAYYQQSLCLALANFQTASGQYGDIIDGCQFYSTKNGVTTYWYFTANVNASVYNGNVALPGQGARTFNYCSTHFGLTQTDCPPTKIPVTLQAESWDVYSCGLQQQIPLQNGVGPTTNIGATGTSQAVYFGQPLPGITPQCLGVRTALAQANANLSSLAGTGVVIAFLIGILLVILGTGIGFTLNASILGIGGGGAGASSNPQGTRMAQTLGIGLIVWVPIYSEFSPWISQILPNGLDIIVALVFTGSVFFGLYMIMLSGTTTTN